MKKIFILTFLTIFGIEFSFAQENAEVDTTIYVISDQKPRFPGCEQLDTTELAKYDCSQKNLLGFIYDNVKYPFPARQQNLEGTVVSSFVIEKDGTISSPVIVKDIGGGCGEEVLRVVGAMNQVGIRWKPAKKDGKTVRIRFNLPVKFRLEEALDYAMVGQDSVYTNLDKEVFYTNGEDALIQLLESEMEIPKSYQDSCFIGYMDVSLLVNPNQTVKIMNVNDYNNMGFDFQFEAIRLANMTYNQWTPAERNGRQVSTITDIRIPFSSINPACASVTANFEKAEALAFEGGELYNTGSKEEGIAKLSEAIAMFPENADFLYLRGQAYLAEKDFEKACEDFGKVKNILTTSPIHSIMPLLCK